MDFLTRDLNWLLTEARNDPAVAAQIIEALAGRFVGHAGPWRVQRGRCVAAHATGCAATVIGANVKVGGFQQVTANVGFDPNIPSGRGFWSLISSLVNAPGNPFGANAHPGLKV